VKEIIEFKIKVKHLIMSLVL